MTTSFPPVLPAAQRPGAILIRSEAAQARAAPGDFGAALEGVDAQPQRKSRQAKAEPAVERGVNMFVDPAPANALCRVDFASAPPTGRAAPGAAAQAAFSPTPRAGLVLSRGAAPKFVCAAGEPAPPRDAAHFDASEPTARSTPAGRQRLSGGTQRLRIESVQVARELPPARETPSSAPGDFEPRAPVADDERRVAPHVDSAEGVKLVDAPIRRPQGVSAPAASPVRPIAPACEPAAPVAPIVAHALRLEIAAPGLGGVSLGLRLRAATLDLRLRVDDAQEAAAIERDAPALAERLRAAGYAVETIVVERREAMEANADPRREAGGDGARQTPRRKGRDESTTEAAANDPDRRDGVYL